MNQNPSYPILNELSLAQFIAALSVSDSDIDRLYRENPTHELPQHEQEALLKMAIDQKNPARVKAFLANGHCMVSQEKSVMLHCLEKISLEIASDDPLVEIFYMLLAHPSYQISESDITFARGIKRNKDHRDYSKERKHSIYSNIFSSKFTIEKINVLLAFKSLITSFPIAHDCDLSLIGWGYSNTYMSILSPILFGYRIGPPSPVSDSLFDYAIAGIILHSGLIPTDLNNNIIHSHVSNGGPSLQAFAPLLPPQSRYQIARAARLYCDYPGHPQHSFIGKARIKREDYIAQVIDIMRIIITNQSYLHNPDDRILLQQCCNLLEPIDPVLPLLNTFADFTVLDDCDLWLQMEKHLPNDLPSHIDKNGLPFFKYAKWWIASQGTKTNIKDNLNTLIKLINVDNLQTNMELLSYVIQHLLDAKKQENNKTEGCKKILNALAAIYPELYWLIMKMAENDFIKPSGLLGNLKSQKSYIDEKRQQFIKHGGNVHSDNIARAFPLLHYILCRGKEANIESNMIRESYKDKGFHFLNWFEIFILSCREQFGIKLSTALKAYPQLLTPEFQANLEKSVNNNALGLGRTDGLFYSLPKLSTPPTLVLLSQEPSAPPQSAIQSVVTSRVHSPEFSRATSTVNSPEDTGTPTSSLHTNDDLCAETLIAKLAAVADPSIASSSSTTVTDTTQGVRAVAADQPNTIEPLLDQLKALPAVPDHGAFDIVFPPIPQSDKSNSNQGNNSRIAVMCADTSGNGNKTKTKPADPPNTIEPLPAVSNQGAFDNEAENNALLPAVPSSPRKSMAEKAAFFKPSAEPLTLESSLLVELERLDTMQDKLEYINTAFARELENLTAVNKIRGYAFDTNSLVKKMTFKLNLLADLKQRIESNLYSLEQNINIS